MTPEERFNSKIKKDCWIWTGAPNADGYGTFYVTSTDQWRAHRYAYTLAYGPIPSDMEVDHLCNVRMCVRPDHLEAVTREENTRRRMQRNETCKYGHSYAEHGGWRKRKSGGRYCKECNRIRTADSYARRKAERK